MKALTTALLASALFAGCSSNNQSQTSSPSGKNASAVPKPLEKITGRVALQKTYIQARGWASDTLPFLEESQSTSDATGRDGASAVWRARFGSRIRATAKAFVWSGTDAPDAPERGIIPGSEDAFSPNNTSTQTFDLAFLKSDSDRAFSVAQDHGGKKLLEKTPTLPVTYRLVWEARDHVPVWHVLYGDRKLAVAVNASTGEFIRVEK